MNEPADRPPARDNHGHVLPQETSAPVRPLADLAIDTGLAALPGWEHRDALLVRQVRVPADSRDGLIEGVRHAVGDDGRVAFVDEAEAVLIRLGAQGAVLPADLEAAARVDAVLSGSGRDTGTTG
ncbi:MAG: hypothetical protein ACT4PP_13135 [Sporichthyaceae bacterium]